jgi:glutathione synthase/RimK-type ligase-like ATP-grasp enzyme
MAQEMYSLMGSIASKLWKTEVLVDDKSIRTYVPKTKPYSEKVLDSMLKQYGMVYIKPDLGTGGSGVIRVEKSGETYRYQHQTTVRKFYTLGSLHRAIMKATKKRSYLIQRGIDLLRHDGRAFDIRVMVQKNKSSKWETTGVIGRLGNPDKIVTNVCKGGVSKSVPSLLKHHVGHVNKYMDRLREIGCKSGVQLSKKFSNLNELGLDIGIDDDHNLWILEVNTRPAIYGFKALKDKRIYEKIARLQKAYLNK